MTFSPFYMGNDTIPYEADGYVRSNNYGAQLNFMVPLDGGMIELCKQIASRHEQKMRLEYELARALKCTEIMKAGFTFRPGSRVEVLCHDIIPIVSEDAHRIAVSAQPGGDVQHSLTAGRVLIAVGGRPLRPSIPGAELGWVSDDMFLLERFPEHVVVVGAGFIACEFACILRGLGTAVVSCCLRA